MTRQVFQIPNRLDAVDPLALELEVAVAECVNAEVAFRFAVCVSEALTNLVKHAQPSNPDATICVYLMVSEDTVVIEIFDPDGVAPFDLRDHAKDLDEVEALAESGRGLGLIIACADAVDYGMVDAGMRLRLSFWPHSNDVS